MIVINTVSDTKFSFNGITYHKNFMPFVTGNKIAILNVYDACITLTDAPTHFSEYVVNGVAYTSVDTLQASLLDVIYTRLSLGTISGTGTVTNVSLSLGSTGTDVNGSVASPTTTPIITLNFPTASATNRGVLSSADWSVFNGKQNALGFTPYNATNPAGYITGITSGMVTTALGFTPYDAANPNGYTSNLGTVTSVSGTGSVSGLTLSGTVTSSGSLTLGGTLSLTSGQVTTALGFTPYNATNPAGYITSAALSGYLPLTGGTLASSGSANTLNINHTSGSGIALNILKNGNGEALTIVKGSGSGNAASITGGITLLSELNLTTKLADAHINSAATWNAKIGGSGTTNYLAKFTASGAVGNSGIFESGGNVGIGTTSPLSKLQVSSDFGKTDTTNRTIGAFTSNDASNPSRINFGITGGASQSARVGTIQTDEFGVVSGGSLSLQPFGGNVGIGTTSPQAKLDVIGGGGVGLFKQTALSLSNDEYALDINNLAQGSNMTSAGAFRIKTNANNSAFVVNGLGNVLIGTTTDAGFKLDVNGSFRATSLVKSGGTSSQFLKADGSVDSSAYITGLSWAGLTSKPTTISGFGITDAVSNVQGVQGAWTGTQAQYDAIATKSSTTIYFIQ